MASMWSKPDQSEWDLGTFARNAGIKDLLSYAEFLMLKMYSF